MTPIDVDKSRVEHSYGRSLLTSLILRNSRRYYPIILFVIVSIEVGRHSWYQSRWFQNKL